MDLGSKEWQQDGCAGEASYLFSNFSRLMHLVRVAILACRRRWNRGEEGIWDQDQAWD